MKSKKEKLTIALTMGDPAGIGPEIVAKVISQELLNKANIVLIGCPEILFAAISEYNREFTPIECVSLTQLSQEEIPALSILESSERATNLILRTPSAEGGRLALDAVKCATELCLQGLAQAMVTAPVSKEAIEMGGVSFTGHTEYISELCGEYDEMMMMSSPLLNVGYVTTHVSLAKLPSILTRELIKNRTRLVSNFLIESGHANTRVALCGLNPHAGENGLFGQEETEIIIPAIKSLQKEGLLCDGPFPADTLFVKNCRDHFGAILAMYHDQGGIPFKMLSFEDGVNHTLGLPIIRTSVDHGTAWDLVGKNKAHTGSLKAAVEMAITLADNRE
ncbi:MAG: 4-hydroxythreonine-4-phosphate dehydrogenase PdxA [Planctomycetes bacterium]|nr:4-hydroxythreonine-4-phosphate dehydrogenase PdxA [Planctomycetota bacterium]